MFCTQHVSIIIYETFNLIYKYGMESTALLVLVIISAKSFSQCVSSSNSI